MLSKTNSSEYVGVIIDNSQLDEAIDDEWLPQQLELELVSAEKFSNLAENHEHGTIIEFDGIRGGIWNQVDYLKQIIARYFRFSVLDKSFTIYVNGSEITIDELRELAKRTEFLWNINNHEDLYVTLALEFCSAKEIPIEMSQSVRGFIASVDKPSSLKIPGVDEKAGVDLFVKWKITPKRHFVSDFTRQNTRELFVWSDPL